MTLEGKKETAGQQTGRETKTVIYDIWSKKKKKQPGNKQGGKLKQLYMTLEVKKETVGQQTGVKLRQLYTTFKVKKETADPNKKGN